MPDPLNRPLHVFLCHASQDKLIVRDLYNRLNVQGWIDPWLDEEKLFPGQDWNLEIEKAVEAADIILVCLSNNSITKEGYIQRELRYVLDIAEYKPEGTLFIIPVRLEDCEPPRRLRIWQYADFFPEADRKNAFERLLVSLRMRAKRLGISIDKAVENQTGTKLKKSEAERAGTEKLVEKPHDENVLLPDLPEKKSPLVFKSLSFGIVITIVLTLAGLILSQMNFFRNVFAPVEPNPTKNMLVVVPTYIATSAQEGIGISSTMVSDSDGMTLLYIPAGEFTMGSENGELDEKPTHKVYLDAYRIDQTEVTNRMYAKCVQAARCNLPTSVKSNLQDSYYDNPDFENHPVIYVSWNDANSYCSWAGRRLPTEAEWEKAARGGVEGKAYPWGNELPACKKGAENGANFAGNEGCNSRDPEIVKNFAPNSYGVYDMAGNVWEWTADWYGGTYYQEAPYSNPSGADSGIFRIIRGGSWNFSSSYLRSSFRGRDDPTITAHDVGFRCAQNVSP